MKKSLYILAALLFVGCVDEDIDLNNIQGNIGITADNLTIPLGSLKEKSLGEMIGDDNDNLISDSVTGDYSLHYAETSQSFTLNGVLNTFTIPGTRYALETDYPTFTLSSSDYKIDELFDVNAKFSGVEIKPLQSVYVPSGIEVSGLQDGKVGHTIEIDVPDYIESIDRVYVKHDDSLPGAPIRVEFDLGSIGDVNGGGSVTVELVVPDGFELYGEDLQPITGNTFRVENKKFSVGQHKVSFVAYLGSITNCPTAQGGKLTLPGELEYHVSYKLTSAGGNVTFTETPTLRVSAALECEDAEVTLNAMDLTPQENTFANVIEIAGVPEQVKGVSNIDFIDSSITFTVEGLDWWDDAAVAAGAMNDIWVEVGLPKIFVLSSDNKGFNKNTNTFHATLAELDKGVTLNLDKIDFDGEITPDSRGRLSADLAITIRAGLQQGAKIRLLYLRHEGGVKVSAGYDDTKITVASITGKVGFEHSESLVVSLAGFDADKISIDGLGISPVIDFSVSNPITMPLYVSAKLVPIRDGKEDSASAVSINRFELSPASAKVENSGVVITPATTAVRISKGGGSADGMQGVDCDLESVFNGKLPEKLNIDLSIATDAALQSTLYVAEKYEAQYGYAFALPLTFGESLNLSYSDTAKGLNSTLSDINLDLYVDGEIYLIAEVKNSTPLNLELNAELLDLEGKPAKLQIVSDADTVIKGSNDGVTPVVSTIRMKVTSENPKNTLDGLSSVDAIKYALKATSAANGVALSSHQTLSVQFMLQLNGNINVDMNEL